MLIVRFRETFRERQMEWALTAGSTGWGAIILQPAAAFERPFYAPLARIAPECVWGWSMFMVGVLGLVVLFINGAWRRTPFFRQIASVSRMVAWSGLMFGTLSVDWQSAASAIYGMILAMEAMALSNATADGQRYGSGRVAGHDR